MSWSILHGQVKYFEMDMAPEDVEPSYDYIISLVVEDDKYSFLANTNCDHNSTSCLAFCQIDKSGQLITLKKYNFNLPISSNNNLNLIKNEDGSYIIAADLYEDTYIRYPIIIKLDNNGDSLWTKIYKTGNPLIDVASGIERLPDGNYILVSYGFNSSSGEIAILKIDPFGKLLWSKNSGLTSKYKASVPTYMKVLSNGNIVISFRTEPYINQGTAGNNFAIFDSSGVLKSEYRITKHIGALPYIYPVTDTTFFYACPTDTFLLGNGTNLIHGIITDKGIKLHEYSFPSPEVRRVSGITKSNDGSLYLFDQRDDWTYGKTAYWISKHSSEGSLIWEKSYLESTRLFAHMPGFLDLDIESDGTIVASGAIRDTMKFHTLKQNAYIVHFNQNGCINLDTCPEKNLITYTINHKENNSVILTFPNPVSNKINFVFTSNLNLNCRLQISDVFNNIILDKQVFINGGKYEEDINYYLSGTYFFTFFDAKYKLRVGKFIKI
jgi:hypothetical protein